MTELTGERTLPGVAEENYWFRRHEAAYAFAARFAGGRVLEVGCGEGYGTAMLAERVLAAPDPRRAVVLGLDYDGPAVAHAARAYPAAHFVRASLAHLPVAAASVDVLVSLQVIEHVWLHAEFVDECVRVARPGALLVISTPNRLTFSPGGDGPSNPFHTHEFTAAELTGLLRARGLRVDTVLGVHAGARLRALDERHGGSFAAAQLAAPPPRWSERLRADVASVTAADFVIRTERDAAIEASLDVIVLARRI